MMSLTLAGRIVGATILAGYALDILSNFVLQGAIRTAEGPGSLFAGAAAQPGLIGAIVLCGVASSVIALGAAGLMCQLSLGRGVAWLAFAFLGLKAASLGMGGGELASYQIMRSLGAAVAAEPGGAIAGQVAVLETLAREIRDGAHFPHLLVGGIGAFALYLLLAFGGFIPRWLGWLGLAACASQMTGVFTGVLGHDVPMGFLLPLFVVHLGLALWLLIRGFPASAAAQEPAAHVMAAGR